MALLEVKNLTKNFGGLTAVGDVTMELNEGELVGRENNPLQPPNRGI